ncbi:hypothetical protein E2562_027492 [Oryza meyeriana var. granulata]|uniref:Uncharacterized protein n=1 Tax=Oryza meyeriana var. granulata TaxID=110450 RepID=A0A6G1E2N9_9ORYZ|nr:hypothetical protein E2562_027492 [Oryza meyeriana var. granulata]
MTSDNDTDEATLVDSMEATASPMGEQGTREMRGAVSTSGGVAGRGALGPCGLRVLADKRQRGEQTFVYFYVAGGLDGRLHTYFF